MRQYWKKYVWEYLMCVAAASMLLLNVAQGFYIPDAMADSIPLALLSCAVLLLLFYTGGYNKVTLVLVPVITAVLVALSFLFLRAQGVDIVDEEGSGTAFYIYWFAFAVICIVVYLCSRFRLGVALLFVIGCAVNGCLEFLEFYPFSWAGMLFACSCMVLFLLRQHRAQAMKSSTADPHFFRFFRCGLLVVLAGAVLSCGIFFAVIRPLSPPTMDLEFLERYLAFNILEHTGISDTYEVQDENEYTDQTDDTLDDTEQTDEGETPVNAEMDVPENQQQPDVTQPPSGQTELSAVSYTLTPLLTILLWIAVIVLVLVLPPALRIWLRRRRMKAAAAMEPVEQIQWLYRFYLKKFRHLGWKKRPGETAAEFASRSGDALERYLAGTCGLQALTDAFSAARYGAQAPSQEACAQYRQIYPLLLKNCRTQLGTVRYLTKFYVL